MNNNRSLSFSLKIIKGSLKYSLLLPLLIFIFFQALFYIPWTSLINSIHLSIHTGISTPSVIKIFYWVFNPADYFLLSLAIAAASIFVLNFFVLFTMQMVTKQLLNKPMHTMNLNYGQEKALVRISKVFSNQELKLNSFKNILGVLSRVASKIVGTSRVKPTDVFYSDFPIIAFWVEPKTVSSCTVRFYYLEDHQSLKLLELLKSNLDLN